MRSRCDGQPLEGEYICWLLPRFRAWLPCCGIGEIYRSISTHTHTDADAGTGKKERSPNPIPNRALTEHRHGQRARTDRHESHETSHGDKLLLLLLVRRTVATFMFGIPTTVLPSVGHRYLVRARSESENRIERSRSSKKDSSSSSSGSNTSKQLLNL